MTTTDFNYKIIQGEKIPVVPIKLSRIGKEIVTDALIDSGSAFSVIYSDVGTQLGLPLRGETITITGAGGKETILYTHSLDAEIADKRFVFKFGLPARRSDTPFTILGRDSIFENFEVKFRQKESKFTLSDY
jgi:hypothetical protein